MLTHFYYFHYCFSEQWKDSKCSVKKNGWTLAIKWQIGNILYIKNVEIQENYIRT